MLPLVVFEAHGSDRLVVTVNGEKFAAAPVHRDEIGRVLTELVTKFAVPTRVELHEQDGSVHADIVQPPPPEPGEEDSGEEPPVRRRRHRSPELVELHADGFVDGEDVAVAVILRHGSAGPGGRVRALIDRAEVPALDRAEVVLIGRISGTTSIQHLT